jgi:hypothetical protein
MRNITRKARRIGNLRDPSCPVRMDSPRTNITMISGTTTNETAALVSEMTVSAVIIDIAVERRNIAVGTDASRAMMRPVFLTSPSRPRLKRNIEIDEKTRTTLRSTTTAIEFHMLVLPGPGWPRIGVIRNTAK